MKEYLKIAIVALIVIVIYNKVLAPNLPFLSSLEEEL